MKNGNKYLQLFVLCILLYSCSKDFRASRKIAKLQSWGYLKTDSVIVHDTIKGFRTDTIVRFDTTHTQDTLTVIKDGVRSVTVIKWKERLITQEITKQDTIIKYVKSVTTVNNPDKHSHVWYWVGIVTMAVIILGLVFKGK